MFMKICAIACLSKHIDRFYLKQCRLEDCKNNNIIILSLLFKGIQVGGRTSLLIEFSAGRHDCIFLWPAN